MSERNAKCFACGAVGPGITEAAILGWHIDSTPYTDDFCQDCVVFLHNEGPAGHDCKPACAIALSRIEAGVGRVD